MAFSVGVMGASGYTGGELLRLVSGHPDLALVAAGARERVGQVVTQVHPQLDLDDGWNFVENGTDDLLAADVVLMALPAGRSGELNTATDSVRLVIDLGADHRLRDPAQWTRYYGDLPLSEPWTYGLPELPGQRAAIAASDRIANPGCYATAVQLALAPLLSAGLLADEAITVSAASGTSGAGRRPTDALLATNVMGSMSAYKAGGVHQHTPEVEQQLTDLAGRPVRVCFTPLLAPMPRGIIATCFGRAAGPVETADVLQVLREAYEDESFVTVLPAGRWPATGAVLGTNRVQLSAASDQRTGVITLISTLDNLGKGAAGQAIQNLNLALGLPETAGLSGNGVRP
ncbi:MAG: N-acetyl-gamma-glutamyl-phosphate reductase [Candidatus Nanopelagicales bacterium]|nr:N-acetyl-gamma-glutamyl-phosphate reductase [Candidatus Nanopelagicales bacterium]